MLALKAYRLLSKDPTYTTPLSTAGEEEAPATQLVAPVEVNHRSDIGRA